MAEATISSSKEFLAKKDKFKEKSSLIDMKIPSYIWVNQITFSLRKNPVYRKKGSTPQPKFL